VLSRNKDKRSAWRAFQLLEHAALILPDEVLKPVIADLQKRVIEIPLCELRERQAYLPVSHKEYVFEIIWNACVAMPERPFFGSQIKETKYVVVRQVQEGTPNNETLLVCGKICNNSRGSIF